MYAGAYITAWLEGLISFQHLVNDWQLREGEAYFDCPGVAEYFGE
jgi:hypothetical protein